MKTEFLKTEFLKRTPEGKYQTKTFQSKHFLVLFPKMPKSDKFGDLDERPYYGHVTRKVSISFSMLVVETKMMLDIFKVIPSIYTGITDGQHVTIHMLKTKRKHNGLIAAKPNSLYNRFSAVSVAHPPVGTFASYESTDDSELPGIATFDEEDNAMDEKHVPSTETET